MWQSSDIWGQRYKSKLHSRRNYKHIKFEEFLLFVQFIIFCLLLKKVKTETHKNTILSVVLYGCEMTLREERRLRVFENRVLRRIFCAQEG
jgi:hypothetical protein